MSSWFYQDKWSHRRAEKDALKTTKPRSAYEVLLERERQKRQEQNQKDV